MKTKMPIVLFSIVAACLALSAMPARAQVVVHYNDGDTMLGFRSTDGTNDYLLDLGSSSQFRDAPPGSTIMFTLSSQDLTTVFGADWYTRIDPNTDRTAVLWALQAGLDFGDGTDTDNTLYSTNPNASPTWARHSNASQAYTTSLTDALGARYDGSTSTANDDRAIIQADNATNSYASFQPGGNNSMGISFQTWNPSNEGQTTDALYLDRILVGSGPSQLLGTFSLSVTGQPGTGGVTLTYVAVPEPPTAVSLFAGASLLVAYLVWRRRTLRA